MRYRKLSTLVHPDKCLENVEQAREAFEEVYLYNNVCIYVYV